MKVKEIRDKVITGSFVIGDEGMKEPCTALGMDDWEFYAKRLETMVSMGEFDQKWISVGDRLPIAEKGNPFSEIMQVWDTDGDFYGAFYSHKDKEWYEGFSEVELPNKITHWKPISLPK